ncbi:hypothetical protein [Sorangium cellulosum]|uniref:ADP-ribosylation/crystallin J1 n=1 Tax=Sorangium cellulosum TaxID=56 RepID=A0A150QJE3_SORCE|nr:hypothetical protein [Sorangium cellulosum]KYF68117.1 hypothetical protein BE15_38045 [Sorangium cellulosum]
MAPSTLTTTLYRPVGQAELDLIEASGRRRFPPRLPEQPIFYPVCNEEYATQIASRWNTAEGKVGYVTRFAVRSDFLARYDVQIVGSRVHAEYWIPAEDLEAFNDAIVGTIEVIGEHRAGGHDTTKDTTAR